MKVVLYLLKSCRPKQWVKNFFVFAAILFSQNIFDLPMLVRVVYVFGLFSMLSASVYLINDVVDVEKDRNHPKKKNRPIASGKVPVWLAIVTAIVFAAVSVGIAFKLNLFTGIVATLYLVQSVAYSFYFKEVVIIDVLLVAAGFVLRVFAGAVVIGVPVSVWLLICVILLALFLALCKRRHEISLLSDKATSHRKILQDYSIGLLDQMISIVTSSTLVVYSLYTFMSDGGKGAHRYQMITIPFVMYGIFRYLYLVHRQNGGGEPEEIVLKDKPLIANMLLWVITVGIVLYI